MAKLLSGGNPQIPKGDGDGPVQDYIGALSGWQQELCQQLDSIIGVTVPGVRKGVRWNSPFYGADEGWFAGFHVFADFVKLTFFRGKSLTPPPPGGKSPDASWINIREGELDEAQVAKWVKQAAALPGWGKQ